MRYLHAVAPHEQFVAQGTYRYHADDAPTGLLEYWTIHALPDGAWFMRVDKDGRDFDGRSELIEAWRSPDGDIERFDVMAYGAAGDAVQKGRATYTVEDDALHIGRTINDGERVQETLALPADYVVQPGGYIFFGYVLPQLVERAPLAMILRYGVTDPPEHSFMAAQTHPTLTFYGEADVAVDGKDRTAKQYMAGERGADGTNWHSYYVDGHGIFLRHESDEMQVQLERYAHTS